MKEQIYQLVRHSAGRLKQSLGENNRLLIFFLEPFSGEIQVCWPLNELPQLTAPTAHLVQTCFKRQRSIQVHDSRVDPLIGSISGADFRAALCVPVFDSVNNPAGVIYVDDPEVGALDKRERLEVEQVARALSRRLPKWTRADLPTQTKEASAPSADIRAIGAIVGLVGLFFTAWVLAPATPGEQGADRGRAATAEREKQPADTVRTFVTLLNLRESEQAWNLLAPVLQDELSLEEFAQQSRDWLADEYNRWEFGKREIREGPIADGTAEVHLQPGQEVENARPWTYKLTLNKGEWRISEAHGGGPLVLSAPNSDVR